MIAALGKRWYGIRIGAVTLRIRVERDKGTIRRIELEGTLTGDETSELEELIGNEPRAVCLELSGLRWADSAGLTTLRRLRAQGVELMGLLPRLRWRIEGNEGGD